MNSIVRLIAAVLLSPLAVIPIALGFATLVGFVRDPAFGRLMWTVLWVAFGGVIVTGLPVHFVLRANYRQRSWQYAVAGFLIPAFLSFGFHTGRGRLALAIQILLLGLCGAAVAWVFWAIAVLKRRRTGAVGATSSHVPAA